jgi:hypothetical protein
MPILCLSDSLGKELTTIVQAYSAVHPFRISINQVLSLAEVKVKRTTSVELQLVAYIPQGVTP